MTSHETIDRRSFSSRDREVDFSVTTVLEPPKNSMAGRGLKAFFFSTHSYSGAGVEKQRLSQIIQPTRSQINVNCYAH